jgi:hypothetical protein
MAPLRRGRDPAARRTSGTTVVSPRRATNLGDDAEGAPSSAAGLESPPGSGGEGGSPGVGGSRKAEPPSAGGVGRARTFQAPHPARPARASRSSCHTSSRVEVDLDSVACTPPPHGSTGIGIWQCPQLLPAARHSAGPRARAARRDLACTARAGRSRVLLAKLLVGEITLIFLTSA